MKNLIFISLLVFLFSCTKGKGNIYIEGKVINSVSGEAIPNVRIKLVRSNAPFNSSDILKFVGAETVKTVFSDANGYYRIEHLGSLLGKYYLLPEFDGEKFDFIRWSNTNKFDILYGKIKVGDEIYSNLELVPFGNFYTYVKNVNCEGEDDSLSTSFTYLLTGKKYDYNYFRTGCYEKLSTSKDMDNPIGDYQYDWHVIRNGVRTDCTKVFTVYENQNTLVEIFY